MKSYVRAKPRKKPKQSLPWVVVDELTGKVRSRHKTFSAAVAAERRANRARRRQGQKPIYEARRGG